VPNDIHIPLELLANECLEEIKIKVKGPIAIYAQCVSGALGLRLAYLLEQEGVKIISLFEAANFPSPRLPGKIFELWSKIVPADRWISNRVYRETLRSIGNSDETENGKEEDFIINGIRYEARQAENYFSSHYYRKDLIPLKCPICCIIGERDRTTEFYEERYHEWEKFSHCVKLKTIENAGHFFQKYQARELSGIIIEEIISVLQPESMSDVVPELTKQEEKMVYNSSADAHLSTQSPSISLFLFIILGQIISIVGSNLSGFALGVWIYQKTGSITQFSLISLCALLPSILLAPIGGAIADRWDKRKIMIGSDVFGILGSLLVFCMFLLGNLQVWHICIAAALGSIGATFQRPAFLSAIPQIVPKQYIGQANGIIQLGMSGGEMLGPILGGLLIVILGLKGIILLDVISCLVSVATLCLVRFPKVLFKKREEPFIKELIGGWRYIAKRRSFVIMIIFFVVSNFLMSMVTVLFTPLATTFTSTKVLGIVLAANAAGVLIGSMVMSLWGGTKRRADGMVGYVILTGLSIIVAGIRPSPIWVGLGLFLFGFSVAFIDTHWQILIQSKVGLELQGRVFSINQMLVFAMRPLAFLMAGPICEKILKPFIQNNNVFTKITSRLVGAGEGREMGLFFLIIGGILTIWGYLGFCFRPLRYMEDVLPDAIPGSIILKDKDKMQALAEKEVRNRPIDSQVGETKNITTTMN
jgi:MFS family permease/surfactin synthase thioesterase subunit